MENNAITDIEHYKFLYKNEPRVSPHLPEETKLVDIYNTL